MDLNTIQEIARLSKLDSDIDWRESDAWLAGGPWPFSEAQPHLRGLIDLQSLGWEPLIVSEQGRKRYDGRAVRL